MWKYLSVRKLGAIFAETLLLMGCVLVAYALRMRVSPFEEPAAAAEVHILLKAFLIALVFQLFLHLKDLYSFRGTRATRQYYIDLAEALVLATVGLTVLYYLLPALGVGRGILVLSIVFGVVFLLVWHTLLRSYFGKRTPRTNLIVLGTGQLAREAVREILKRPELGIRVVGFVDDSPQLQGVSIVNPKVIGTYRDLPRLMAENRVDQILVGMPDRRGKLPINELLDCKTRGMTIEDVATFYERVAGKIPVDNLKPSWMVFSPGFKLSRVLMVEKRILSFAVSTLLLLAFSPIILLLVALIKLDSKGTVLYRQERVGQYGKTFTLLKFRSMQMDAEQDTGPVWSMGEGTDPRVTRVGRWMRRFRLDELPQLFNVFRGDMSLVGPRPERPAFVQQLAETIPFYNIRHVIKPGITGWAQINYKYASSFQHAVEKLQYDLFYIKNISIILDILICMQTAKIVLVRTGS